MPENIRELDLVALLNEKYGFVRKRCEQLWNRDGRVQATASERYILSRIGDNQLSVSEIARLSHITRQAAHKYIRSLAKKGLVQSVAQLKNKRDKYSELTPLGKQCLGECQEMGLKLERQIASSIGQENMDALKQIITQSWAG